MTAADPVSRRDMLIERSGHFRIWHQAKNDGHFISDCISDNQTMQRTHHRSDSEIRN